MHSFTPFHLREEGHNLSRNPDVLRVGRSTAAFKSAIFPTMATDCRALVTAV